MAAIRDASAGDAEAICLIYNQGIEDRVATLETELRTPDERALLEALVERARALGYHKLVLAAFPLNHAGMRLYQRSGFRQVGVYWEQGRVDGRWVDIVVMEKLL